MTSLSTTNIGRAFGGRDHTTVMHGCDRIAGRIEDDFSFRKRIEELIDLGVATSDVQTRYDLYTELWAIVMDTATILPLYHNPEAIAWSKNITIDVVNPTYYHITDFHWAN